MALTAFIALLWILVFAKITGCQAIRVTIGNQRHAVVRRFCPHVIAAEVANASSLGWSNLYYNQLELPGPNHLVQHVAILPNLSKAYLTFGFVMEPQDVMLVATTQAGVETRIFHIHVEEDSGPINVTTGNGDVSLGDYAVNDEVTISCAVTTCRSMAYSLQLAGPTTSHRSLRVWNGTFDRGVNNFTFCMRAGLHTPGEYKCTVRAALNGHAFALSSVARITGTPRVPESSTITPTTPPDPDPGVSTHYGVNVSLPPPKPEVDLPGSASRHTCPSSVQVLAASLSALFLWKFLLRKDYSA